ncbi:MAG: hypothetical protein LBI57_03010 [Helicobacteraceae bacterium]|jgi:hypothetical protein|nr:hypothetical protein [Helicobacteraceae bacterium]
MINRNAHKLFNLRKMAERTENADIDITPILPTALDRMNTAGANARKNVNEIIAEYNELIDSYNGKDIEGNIIGRDEFAADILGVALRRLNGLKDGGVEDFGRGIERIIEAADESRQGSLFGEQIAPFDRIDAALEFYGERDSIALAELANKVRAIDDAANAERGMNAPRAETTDAEKGAFGTIWRGFEGRPNEAVAHLLQTREGEAPAALRDGRIGEIDLVWGEAGTGHSDGWGIAKLERFHPEMLDKLEIINELPITSVTDNRVVLQNDRYRAVVQLNFKGDKKTWLLTAFDKTDGGVKRIDTNAVAPRDDQALSQTARNETIAQEGARSQEIDEAVARDLREKDGAAKAGEPSQNEKLTQEAAQFDSDVKLIRLAGLDNQKRFKEAIASGSISLNDRMIAEQTLIYKAALPFTEQIQKLADKRGAPNAYDKIIEHIKEGDSAAINRALKEMHYRDDGEIVNIAQEAAELFEGNTSPYPNARVIERIIKRREAELEARKGFVNPLTARAIVGSGLGFETDDEGALRYNPAKGLAGAIGVSYAPKLFRLSKEGAPIGAQTSRANTRFNKAANLQERGADIIKAGYSPDYSMSNNALAAYGEGKKPLSKWTRKDILDRAKEVLKDAEDTDIEIADLEKLPTPLLKQLTLDMKEWHHTSKRYNKTNFYDVKLNGLTKADIESRLASKRTAKQTDEIFKKNPELIEDERFRGHYEVIRDDGVIMLDSLMQREGSVDRAEMARRIKADPLYIDKETIGQLKDDVANTETHIKEIIAENGDPELAERLTNRLKSKRLRLGRFSIDFMLKAGKGEVSGAFYRPETGYIDLVWGKEGANGYGLAHIIEKRRSEYKGDMAKTTEFLRKLPETIANSAVDPTRSQGGKIALVDTKTTAIIALERNERDAWLLTAYQDARNKKNPYAQTIGDAQAPAEQGKRIDTIKALPLGVQKKNFTAGAARSQEKAVKEGTTLYSSPHIGGAILGSMTGFETDEDGNISYNPRRGAMGAIGSVGVVKLFGLRERPPLAPSFTRMFISSQRN